MNNNFYGPHGHDYQGLVNCLSSFLGERIVFVHNPGNAGDNVINLGTYRLFDRIGLQYECGKSDHDYAGRVIVYSGGGALVPFYSGSDIFFRRNHPSCKALILLPHTVRAHADMISEMDERCHLFTRERNSYHFVATHANRANVYVSHDMAFLLDHSYIDSLSWDAPTLFRSGLLKSWLVMILKFTIMAKLNSGSFSARRTDVEGDGCPPPPNNIDLSMMLATGDMSLPHCVNVAKALSKVLKACRMIETDRLHIAILSTILGLPVEMSDNNYGKNRDIFDQSIRDYFDNTRFVQTSASNPA